MNILITGAAGFVGQNLSAALEAISHDKKASGDTVKAVFVNKVGSFEIKSVSIGDVGAMIKA